jgi:membrane protein YdbS with pleckstrin-like domain
MTEQLIRTMKVSVERAKLWEMVLIGALLTFIVIAIGVASLATENGDLWISAAQFAASAVIALIGVLIYGELRRQRRERERGRERER